MLSQPNYNFSGQAFYTTSLRTADRFNVGLRVLAEVNRASLAFSRRNYSAFKKARDIKKIPIAG
jgi:hypothetical protein